MSPELSKTRNHFLPYTIMEGSSATLLQADSAEKVINGLAENMDTTPEELKSHLEQGGKINFTWAEEQ